MKSEKCRCCMYYSADYKQRSSDYSKLSHGFCSKYQKPQINTGFCDQFVSNEKKEKMLEWRRLSELDRALKSINDIAGILKEKAKEENK